MTAFYVCVWTVFTIPQEFKKKKKSTSSSCINWSVGSGSAANIRIILDIVSVLITGILPTGVWCPLVHTLKTFLISSSFLSLFNALICRTFADRIQSKRPKKFLDPSRIHISYKSDLKMLPTENPDNLSSIKFYLKSWCLGKILSRSGELRTQKLKSHLVRTPSLNLLALQPGVCQNIAIHATPTARDFFLPYFHPSDPFTCIFSKTSPNISCVGCIYSLGVYLW